MFPLLNPESPARSTAAFEKWVTVSLREGRMRSTKAVRDVLRLMHPPRKPQSAAEIHGQLKHLGYDLSTIYLILRRLERAAMVKVALIHQNSMHFVLAEDGPASFQVVDRATGKLQEMDPAVVTLVSRTLAVVEERLRELGYADVSFRASFRANIPRDLPKPTVNDPPSEAPLAASST